MRNDKFKRFFMDHLLYSILYFLAIGMILLFYVLTTSGVEIVYPIGIGVFFYVIAMVIRYLQVQGQSATIQKLAKNASKPPRASHEYEEVYEAFLSLHKQYHEQITMLQQKSQEDQRFISAFIHNLKTPVTVSSIILQRTSNGELKEEDAIQQLYDEMERLNSGLNHLLDLQRLREAEKDFVPERVNLADEVTKAINTNKSLFINSHVYPKFETEDVYIYTDPKWNQVLINQIISNAVKYSKGEENHYVYFSVKVEESCVRLVIRDEGIGIPEYDLPRIYEAFFTGENGRKGYNSSGIGLYLCKCICNQLNQRIQVENNDGCQVTISYLSKM